MELDWLLPAGVFVIIGVVSGVAIGRGRIRPVGFVPGRPSLREVGIVLLAMTFAAVLLGVGYSPIGSAALSVGLGALFMSILVALSRRSD